VFARPARMGKTINLSMLERFLTVPTEFDSLMDLETSASVEVIKLAMPKERGKVRTYEKWKDNLLMYMRNSVEVCEKYEVGVGIEDDEIGSFFERMIEAACAKKERGTKVWLLIDDFDGPLLHAASNGFIQPALDFYRLLFPFSLLDRCPHIAKIVIMSRCCLEIPGCFISAPCVDGSLLQCHIQAPSKKQFGFYPEEVKQLCS